MKNKPIIDQLGNDKLYFRNAPNFTATLDTTGKTYYLIPMEGYSGGSVTFRLTTGAGSTAALKSYICNNPSENTSTITIANWHDDSVDSLGATSIACAAGATTDHVIHFDTNYGCLYYLLEVDYTDSADSDLEIYSYLN